MFSTACPFQCTYLAPCNDSRVRLTDNDGHDDYGRVLVCVNGEWTTVCMNNDWDKEEASVVCRQLGHSPYGYHLSIEVTISMIIALFHEFL